MESIKNAIASLTTEYEKVLADLASAKAVQDERHEQLNVRELELLKLRDELSERERVQSNREAAISEIRTIAANRKTENATLNEQVAVLNRQRIAAVSAQKQAEKERDRFQEQVLILLKEKKERLAIGA